MMSWFREAAFAILGLLVATAHSAQASQFTLTTSGTIDNGTASGITFGSSGDLTGAAYTLALTFSELGSSILSAPAAVFTSGAVPGNVLITVGAKTISVSIINSYAAFLEETQSEIYAINNGDDGSGNTISVVNAFNTSTALPIDFATEFSRQATSVDLAANIGKVSINLSGSLGELNFTATPTSAQFSVPEPASVILLASGLAFAGWRRPGIVRSSPTGNSSKRKV